MSEFICPHCKQSIFDDDALLCHFCGESLGRTSSGGLGIAKGGKQKWILIALIVLVVGSFLVLMWR